MNQRILSCPSTLLSKGLTLKAGDWRTCELTPDTLNNHRMPRRPGSVASLQNSRTMIKRSSSSSFRKQYEIQRLSSSSLSSAKADGSFNFNANTSRGNATWDDKPISGLAPKQTDSRRVSVSLLDLVQIKMEDPFGSSGNHTKRRSPPKISGTVAGKTPNRNDKKRSSMPDLVPLKEEDHPTRGYSVMAVKNTVWKEKENILSILDVDATTSISPSKGDFSEFIVKTCVAKTPRQIDIRRISSTDLVSLKENDPFMYYSIPSTRSAALKGDYVDLQSVKDAATSSKIPSSYLRKTCISVESCLIPDIVDSDFDDKDCHAPPDLSDVFYHINMECGDENDNLDDDWLYEFSEIQSSR
ncbi:hypothetical protein HJC23_007832 [Cyclotella cryptica]|uniref:Uncharacterized protein n=1 Tax=Cyclotella cryptica TaxID=29204 RepID=A0ABD3R6D2_9STRA